ncbi:hypothetical protein IU500_10480 [Nocardia terpenica]|uniref:Ferredoxin n=1 Tax=Nocardia terpenica TaxID=455432 RepID=A0A161X6U0_9NOCA|nr:hypothetical protein [Nocardia terpenica]KZM68758.1 hypothetical protein AWN90_13235 [Nocardia terpenica]MBF6062378.1 hypothetical protein [Nocardia terpenica]MBF6104466.1 hypothetical protein [Nocardia terpenica]MBF6109678.1 hypothetical protein [Nocardia terpenica]MBF6119984.1 hypothetical protein [Nocardia terpenica]
MAGWAKAPDFADRPERLAQVRAQTVADRQRYLEDGLTPVCCGDCGTRVLVRKASSHQKSVQWTADPAEHCPVFKELSGGPGRPESCPHLERSIDAAVRSGALPVAE